VRDLVYRLRSMAGVSGNSVIGNMLMEASDAIEAQAARVAELERLTARLDGIEAWLRATHGYPYPKADSPHVHTRECYDDPGPGHGPPFLICDF
jgi:hypothetical protein